MKRPGIPARPAAEARVLPATWNWPGPQARHARMIRTSHDLANTPRRGTSAPGPLGSPCASWPARTASRPVLPSWSWPSPLTSPDRSRMPTTHSTKPSTCSAGRLLVAGDDEPQEAAPGSMFVAPRGHRHGFSNPSADSALVLGISGRRHNPPWLSCEISAPRSGPTPHPTPTACARFTPGTPAASCPDTGYPLSASDTQYAAVPDGPPPRQRDLRSRDPRHDRSRRAAHDCGYFVTV